MTQFAPSKPFRLDVAGPIHTERQTYKSLCVQKGDSRPLFCASYSTKFKRPRWVATLTISTARVQRFPGWRFHRWQVWLLSSISIVRWCWRASANLMRFRVFQQTTKRYQTAKLQPVTVKSNKHRIVNRDHPIFFLICGTAKKRKVTQAAEPLRKEMQRMLSLLHMFRKPEQNFPSREQNAPTAPLPRLFCGSDSWNTTLECCCNRVPKFLY